MKIIEAINQIDELKPNQYTLDAKIKWLSELDGQIFSEVILTHQPNDNYSYSFNGYGYETDIEGTDLIVPFPYCELYLWYLESKIDFSNGEIGKYNNSAAMYNNAYAAFANYYNRTYMPIPSNTFKF